jgi:pimeloyl-ACP methyl ester carboxylesterase
MALYVEGSGPAVALLQGGPGLSSDSVAPVAELLRHGFRVVRFDHVASTVDGVVEEIEKVREALGEEHWFVLGHSWGAALAALYTVRFPARTAGLVLVHPLEVASEFCDQGNCAVEGSTPDTDERFALEHTPDVAEALWEDLQAAYPDTTGEGYDLTAVARRITRPGLVLLGDCDGIDQRSGQLWAELTGARLVSLPDAGHWSFVEQPRPFQKAVMEFLLAQAARRTMAAA